MINDFKKEDYFSSLFEEPPLIRNISYDMDKGKHLFLDNKGHNYVCNIFGNKKPKYRYNISGVINGEQRKVMKNSKSLSDILISNRYKLSNNSDDNKRYLPSLNKFEGYAQFPRPNCPPFENIPQYFMRKNFKVILKKQIESSLDNEENKKLFKKEEENKGVSYFTSNIKSYISNKGNNNSENTDNSIDYNKDKKLLMRLIDKTCNECKNQSINSLKDIQNNFHTVRALNNFRKRLLNNDETNMINGRKLNEPSQYMINEYKIINKQLFNDFNSYNNLMNRHNHLIKSFSQLDTRLNQIVNNNKPKEKNVMTGRKLLDKITINNLTKKPRNLKKKIFFPNDKTKKIIKSSLNKSEGNLRHNLLGVSRNKKNSDLLLKSSFDRSETNTNKIHFLIDDQETKETFRLKPSYNNLFLFRSVSNENNKAENISFISERYNIFKFRRNIRSLKNLEKISLHERKLLEGYKMEEPKKPKIFGPREEDQPKYKDFGEIYKKELETLEKCNPLIFELEKKNSEKEMEKLKRKKEFKKLEEKVRLKGKKLKIKKPEENK